jgi:hypothetical protein
VDCVDELNEERQKRMDERFARDRERLEHLEVTNEDLKQITARMDVIIENQQKQLENHEKRIMEIESKPARRWESMVNTALQWIVTAFLAATIYFKK